MEVSRGAWNIAHSCCPAEGADLIDFPGTYSLDPLSPDEALTRTMLYDAAPAERIQRIGAGEVNEIGNLGRATRMRDGR